MQDCCFFRCAICSFLSLSFCCQNCSQTPMEWNPRQYTVFILAKWALFDSLIVKKASSSRLSWKEINWKIKYKVLSDSQFKSVCVFIERGFLIILVSFVKRYDSFQFAYEQLLFSHLVVLIFLCCGYKLYYFSSANYLNHRWNW